MHYDKRYFVESGEVLDSGVVCFFEHGVRGCPVPFDNRGVFCVS